jgi:hypothetical protein
MVGKTMPEVSRPSLPLPAVYSRWQGALASAFFNGPPCMPVILFVDDSELCHLAEGVDEPGRDLARAVCELVDPRLGQSMFDRVAELQRRWVGQGRPGPPPTLPVLAVSVLAATRMQRDRRAAQHNYYVRLAEALIPVGTAAEQNALRTELRTNAFKKVAEMWQALDGWLRESPDAPGLSTIREHPELTRIGYPLSQALMRRSDRALLTEFFAALHLGQSAVPAPSALVEYLRVWASRPRGLSPALNAALDDDAMVALLEPLLGGLAASWDGDVITVEGSRRVEFRVCLDLDQWTSRWVAPVVDAVEGDTLTGEVAGRHVTVRLQRQQGHRHYVLDGLPVPDTQSVRKGFRLRGATSAGVAIGAEVIIFTEDPDAGAWVGASAISPFEEHVVAAVSGMAAQVEGVIAAAADEGWVAIRQRPQRPLLAGFAIFHHVVFSDVDRLDEALARMPGLRASSLRPDPTPRPRLAGGLPLMRGLGRARYLAGGEPDLLLPAADVPRKIPASLDGVVQVPPFHASGFPIPLRGSKPLAQGEHVLVAGEEVLRFWIMPGSPDNGLPPATGSLGWDEHGRLGEGEPVVCGAVLAGHPSREPVLVRRGNARTWLVHRDGRCSLVEEPTPPHDLTERAPGLLFSYWEVTPPPSAAWLVERRRGSWAVRRLRAQAPEFVPLDAISLHAWGLFAPSGPADDPLWQLYVRSWERQRGR